MTMHCIIVLASLWVGATVASVCRTLEKGFESNELCRRDVLLGVFLGVVASISGAVLGLMILMK
jgi:hypothetical protein